MEVSSSKADQPESTTGPCTVADTETAAASGDCKDATQSAVATVTASGEKQTGQAESTTVSEKKDAAGYSSMIKAEYVDHNHKRELVERYLPKPDPSETTHTKGQDGTEPPNKKRKMTGRNKKRPVEKAPVAADKLCPSIIQERECSYAEKCKFSHDLAKYMESKPNVDATCYLFETYGKCKYGVTCLFAACHIDGALKNVVNEDLWEKKSKEVNVYNALKRGVQRQLWKRKYNLSLADGVVKLIKDGKMEELGSVEPTVRKSDTTDLTSANLVCKTNVESSRDDSMGDRTSKDDIKSEGISSIGESTSNKIEKIGDSVETSKTVSSSCDRNGAKTSIDVSNSNTLKSSSVENATSTSIPTVENRENGLDTLKTSKSNDCVPQSTEMFSSVLLEGGDNSESNKTASSNCHANKESSEVEESAVCSSETLDRLKGSSSRSHEDVEGIRLRPQEKTKIDFRDKLYLAPLTTVGNLPFRRVCKTLGVDITCGEMALVTNLLQGQQSEWALLKRHTTEDIFGVQLCGSHPDSMTRGAQLLVENCDIDFIDINCGCPIDMIYKRGEGSALMGRHSKLEQVVRGMRSVMGEMPLTMKIRTGIFEDKFIAHSLVPKLRDWGLSAVTLHGRSREQRYTRLADWEYINKCSHFADPMPFFGNGDIMSFEDANQRQEETGVTGLMVARGALIKPWIFTEIKEQRHWDISANERLDLLRDYTNYGLDHWGSDVQGVSTTRRFLLEWLSFLYRYVPVDLLERVPQKINEKPPYYFGRNDLETLLASPCCADWVKISEMLLGPVPDSFIFVPKHRANSYK